MPFSYANPTSGPSAGGIGWFNFGTLTMNPGDTLTGLTGTLKDGSTVTFDMSLALISGTTRSFVATSTPTFPGANFGVAGYTGLLGNVAMYGNLIPQPGVYAFTINNIVVTDAGNNPVPNYTVIIADSERTNTEETWELQTNGGGWNLLATLGANPPTLTGLGTQTANIVGNSLAPASAYVLTTQTPAQVVLTIADGVSSRQAFSIGFATTRLRVQKNVGQRIDASDQFVLNIAGTPNDQATTTGSADGIQSEVAGFYAIPGNTYTINEAMAPGSASPLSAYTTIVSAMNATLAGSIPPTGNLPINFTPALGDDVTYTILNAAPESFTKTVDKAFADIGDVLTYTVTVTNPNNFPVSNVLVTDPTPSGTSYIGNLFVSAPYTGTSPASGITITSIPADGSVVLSWQVQVNVAPPIPNPIMNIATVTVPNGTSGVTNIVTTQVSHAFVSVNKTVDKAYADANDILTYTLLLTNPGNVAANNVVITDSIPAGTTYVAGSTTANIPFSGDPTTAIALSAPIPSGGSATVSFKVKINGVPAVNPIPNTAAISYAYTVDPTKPNSVTATRTSNTVSTEVSTAKLSVTKSADKSISYIGDIITYQLAVTNSGNVPADNVVLTDALPNGVVYQAGTLQVSVPYTAVDPSNINLTNPIAPGGTVSISFQGKVTAIPIPNPAINEATANYVYTVNPLDPDGVSASADSNPVSTIVFRYNFKQQISDLIESVALEQAALAAIANAEGAKIQKMAAMGGISAQELLCLNKSVADMMESLSTLEAVLKQKLSVVSCQINGSCM